MSAAFLLMKDGLEYMCVYIFLSFFPLGVENPRKAEYTVSADGGAQYQR